VLSNGDDGYRQEAQALGLELAPVSLQQLIVYLTSEKSVSAARKAAEV
jgi:ABC-2 type transport system ATP-binding protein